MDWTGLIRLGLRDLRLSPENFWALTPIELLVIAGKEAGSGPMTRAALGALVRAYPDTGREMNDDG